MKINSPSFFFFAVMAINLLGTLVSFTTAAFYVTKIEKERSKVGKKSPFQRRYSRKELKGMFLESPDEFRRTLDPGRKEHWKAIGYIFSNEDEDSDLIRPKKRTYTIALIFSSLFSLQLILHTLIFMVTAILNSK